MPNIHVTLEERYPHLAIDDQELTKVVRKLMQYQPMANLRQSGGNGSSMMRDVPLHHILVRGHTICPSSHGHWGIDCRDLVPLLSLRETHRQAAMLDHPSLRCKETSSTPGR